MNNEPYVKKYDESGTLLNPIDRIYKNEFPNRREKRKKDKRFMGNGRNYSLTIVGTMRYRRLAQAIKVGDKIKIIYHYLLK